ncbi:MAG TPA: hypothetical protein PLV22_01250 [Candidatus Cloacimonadota bacterium]|nr:hypothetical protein [Candidatus Cloacimonadota bacterium]HOQ79928.1 hypothetical protein [Candidatus Cloacimonadota bacterium]
MKFSLDYYISLLMANYKRITIWILILLVLYFFIHFYLKRRVDRIKRRNIRNVPANIWFYSQLVNFELGIDKVNSDILMKSFFEYLQRKYLISDDELKNKTIFKLVNENEKNEDYIELYGNIYHKIENLKQNSQESIILYIKSIKKYFNQDDLSEWIERQKYNDCNDC